ncbi:hypothetical protein BDP27DRAFT_1334902, partial [Rhodocollybia butyracea]
MSAGNVILNVESLGLHLPMTANALKDYSGLFPSIYILLSIRLFKILIFHVLVFPPMILLHYAPFATLPNHRLY